ncbi:MAG: DUF3144 domain-containing protein [Asticcacaulis sp.]
MDDEEQAFLRRAADYIDVCNAQAAEVPGEKVAMSALYGVSRYCAHLCRARQQSPAAMADQRDEAIRMFSEEFTRMFSNWYDHYTDQAN